MTRRRAIMILPQLKDCGGDLSKKWFVEYSCRNPHTDQMKRFRHYEGFSELRTARERYAYAEKRIQELTEKLKRGETPFAKKKVIYEDELVYSHVARTYGKQRESVVNIRTYLSEFLALKQAEVIPHTFKTYQSKLRIFCTWLEQKKLSKVHVSCINQEHICSFFRFIAETNNISRCTVSKYEQILRSFFNYLMKTKKIIDRSPVYDIPRVGEHKDEAPYPIPDYDREVLREYISRKDPQLWLVCMMEYYCAIRPGEELRNLKIQDINFEDRIITIRKDISKNRQTETVDIPRQLLEYMVNVHQLNSYDESAYVFSVNGVPGDKVLGKNNFKNRFVRYRKELGLSDRYKLYSFKHTGGVKLKMSGATSWDLQRHFRHKSIDTTEKYIRRNIGQRSEKIREDFPDI